MQEAEVIVTGTYDFTDTPVEGDFIFQGYPFNVTEQIKGTAEDSLIAGIDIYDTGWVKEFQDSGGEFLLFLAPSEEAFMVPVGGPNGMIELQDGEVIRQDADEAAVFERVLRGEEIPSAAPASVEQDSGQGLWILAGVIIALAVLLVFFGLRAVRNRPSP
ncbi:hypothetical protein [Planococcus lenghuensis]|uniref:hypothetical protein n=1 Tax=Planococcus lenghuensis TaxID=2213202 RepID=UPI0012EC1047|nr:hypothetical protein [Planococcus lenghuensis]